MSVGNVFTSVEIAFAITAGFILLAWPDVAMRPGFVSALHVSTRGTVLFHPAPCDLGVSRGAENQWVNNPSAGRRGGSSKSRSGAQVTIQLNILRLNVPKQLTTQSFRVTLQPQAATCSPANGATAPHQHRGDTLP